MELLAHFSSLSIKKRFIDRQYNKTLGEYQYEFFFLLAFIVNTSNTRLVFFMM